MKKLFISCPKKGRTDEAITHSMEEMHKIAEIIFDEELEVISIIFDELPAGLTEDQKSIYCLGKNIEKMAEADYFIGVGYSYRWRECDLEADIARSFNIQQFLIDADAEYYKFFEDIRICEEDCPEPFFMNR